MKYTTDRTRLRNELKCLARERTVKQIEEKFPDWRKIPVDNRKDLTRKGKDLLEHVDKVMMKQAELMATIDELNIYELHRLKRDFEDE
jgi:hypothetical protein